MLSVSQMLSYSDLRVSPSVLLVMSATLAGVVVGLTTGVLGLIACAASPWSAASPTLAVFAAGLSLVPPPGRVPRSMVGQLPRWLWSAGTRTGAALNGAAIGTAILVSGANRQAAAVLAASIAIAKPLESAVLMGTVALGGSLVAMRLATLPRTVAEEISARLASAGTTTACAAQVLRAFAATRAGAET